MRTTLSLDDDVHQLLQKYAESRSIGLGKATSELVRRGLFAERPTRVNKNGIRVFVLPPDSPKVTSKHVKDLENEE
jgi:hypothetical protein